MYFFFINVRVYICACAFILIERAQTERTLKTHSNLICVCAVRVFIWRRASRAKRSVLQTPLRPITFFPFVD